MLDDLDHASDLEREERGCFERIAYVALIVALVVGATVLHSIVSRGM